MKDPTLEAEKAELIQAVKALYIPLSLFLACVIMAAGTFLIYSEYAVGWAFVGVAGTIMLSAFIALIRFQNKLRVKGIMPQPDDEQADPEIWVKDTFASDEKPEIIVVDSAEVKKQAVAQTKS